MNKEMMRKTLLGTGLLAIGIAGWWAVNAAQTGRTTLAPNLCGVDCGGDCSGDAVSAVPASAVAALMSSGKDVSGNTAKNATPAAPNWEFQDLDGKTVHSSDYKGKVVILDFWATWCGPCRQEIPSFVALQKQYRRQGLAVIGASVDQGGAGTIKDFAEKLGINYRVVRANEKMLKAFGDIQAIPTTFVIDRNGRMVNRHEGFTAKEEFEKEITPLLKL